MGGRLADDVRNDAYVQLRQQAVHLGSIVLDIGHLPASLLCWPAGLQLRHLYAVGWYDAIEAGHQKSLKQRLW
jgi:hypothetical protein